MNKLDQSRDFAFYAEISARLADARVQERSSTSGSHVSWVCGTRLDLHSPRTLASTLN
jgi:hypothetical protein